MSERQSSGSYWRYLPAIFREGDSSVFLRQYLQIFESILTAPASDSLGEFLSGIPDSFSTILGKIPGYLTPQGQREDFVNWLASWLGLVLKEEWTMERKREIIANIVPLYRLRGTAYGLRKYLEIYLGDSGTVSIVEYNFDSFVVGQAYVGQNRVGKGLPYYFEVDLAVTNPDSQLKERVCSIVDREKPAHTYYNVEIVTREGGGDGE
jgi:phage tail-like protein